MRFRTLLFFALLLPLAATALAVMAVMYVNADRHSTEMAHRLLDSVTARAGQEVYAYSDHAVTLARSLQQMGERGLSLDDSDALALQLADMLRVNPNTTWISFSNPKGDFTGAYRTAEGKVCINQSVIRDGKTPVVEHELDASNNKKLLFSNPDNGYDPRVRSFYTSAVARKDLVWPPPYIFYDQAIPGISLAVPLFVKDTLRGVFTVDYDLNYLSELARLAASKNSQVIVFNQDYLLLAHTAVRVVQPKRRGDHGELMTLADVSDPTTQALLEELRKLELNKLTPGTPQPLDFSDRRRTQVACVLPIHLESGPVMFVATVAPKTDFAATAWESSKHAIYIALAAFIGAGVLAYLLAKRISAPITTLVHAADQIGSGNLDVVISLGSIREFRKLSAALENMLANLRDSVRVRTSLNLAREIQRRLLPASPPEIPGLELAGYASYCDETGGDYDFIVPDASNPSRFMLVLGDMMGHGLPSALLMAVLAALSEASFAPAAPRSLTDPHE